mmetsp:Transcript_16488/g.19054  ORF Transcript_16488/g.19054 Transcript_16488/m.19054 type:complete len:93 (-) Transcript_16488:843-1121(-)
MNRFKKFKRYLSNEPEAIMTSFINHLKANFKKNRDRIRAFFESGTIYSEFCLKLFNVDEKFKDHAKKHVFLELWKSCLDVSKLVKNTSEFCK